MSGIVIDTPEGIARARKIALASALALEINTGMRATRHSLIPIAKSYGFTGSRKPAALKWLVEKMQEEFGYEPPATVQRALSK